MTCIYEHNDYCRGQSYKRQISDIKKYEEQSRVQANNLRKSIEERKQREKELAKKEGTLTFKLNKIKSEINKTTKELKKLQDDIRTVKTQKEKTGEDLILQQKEASRWNSLASKEAGCLYRYGLHKKGQENVWLLNAISSKKFGNYIRKQKYMKAIISQKTSVLQRARKQCEAIIRLEENLGKKEVELELLTRQQKKTQVEYEDKKKEQGKLLNEVKRKRKKVEIEIKELEKSAASLQNMIYSLVKKKKDIVSEQEAALYKASSKRTVIWPVEGGSVMSLFGKQPHPELPGTYVFNRGIKIKVPYGSSVISVESGSVLYAKEFQGYGKMLIVDHGKGFYSIYGQLAEFLTRENDVVQKRQAIAKSGAFIYFEIRMNGTPEDPLGWLK